MAFDLKSLTRKKTQATTEKVTNKHATMSGTDAVGYKPLPIIGSLPVSLQYQVLGSVFLISLMITLSALYLQNRSATLTTSYAVAAGDLRVLAYQLPTTTSRANEGDSKAFKELRNGLARLNELTKLLADGGNFNGADLPPTGGNARSTLDAFIASWTPQQRLIERLLKFEKPISLLGYLAEEAKKSAWMVDAAGKQSPMLRATVERIGSGLNRLATSYDDALVAELRTDLGQAIAVASEPKLRVSLTDIADALKALPDDGKELNLTRQFGAQIMRSQLAMTRLADELVVAYQDQSTEQGRAPLVAAIAGSVAMLMLVFIVKAFRDDAMRRHAEALRQQRLAEAAKDATQAAILRLMNEMGDLADGDLTVRATVTEDITGAIADSVNYTIEELSVLVSRINKAAEQVTGATNLAKNTSNELLAATETQAREIQQAGSKVEAMASAMTEMAHSAQESAKVARVSLEVARKGSQAVNDSINGMNEIRGQIQETAKRIKRLGESSQEIGEIVELISDITEQTNVLALNAAIQAASAGEAGRGFSVVAEEVQRLAERSGEATKQIAALVKTIQTDTHDAVAAMEYSTQNVVEGAKRSDAAGQALSEISAVTQRLAQLIENISGSTQKQTETARAVAATMDEILRVTTLTTRGTQQTAGSVAELAALASELKGSVAGFKV